MLEKDQRFYDVIDRDFRDDRPITQQDAEKIIGKFEHRIRGGVRLRHGRIITVEALEERREKVKVLP